ncbi:hypothetical protein [Vreelandella massiliensis]|uniref:hypothetical protein n=1 Tax=Vreelandella massiliensis TaxID=1816686 RepID=UPI00096A7EB6|nr:hypothetical protein [Halomonas massiliensis]
MKYQKVHKPVDERDKLRQFRELDDAFANALRELDDPKGSLKIPTGPPVRSLAALEQEEQEQKEAEHKRDHAKAFRERFDALWAESPLTQAELLALIETLLRSGHWKDGEVPRPQVVSQP